MNQTFYVSIFDIFFCGEFCGCDTPAALSDLIIKAEAKPVQRLQGAVAVRTPSDSRLFERTENACALCTRPGVTAANGDKPSTRAHKGTAVLTFYIRPQAIKQSLISDFEVTLCCPADAMTALPIV